jgi:sec-independent protein translocase protein TatA
MSLLAALGLFGTLGTSELIIILIILLLIFGASKLPQLGGAMGKTIKAFKSEMKDGMAEEPAKTGPAQAGAEARFCAKCGTEVMDSAAGYCPKCGKALA